MLKIYQWLDQLPATVKVPLALLFFPGSVFFQEMIFHQAVSQTRSSVGVLMLLLYSFVLGCFLYLPTYFIRKKWVAKTINTIFLAIIAVLFLVEFFIVQKFQTLFDIRTIVGGAKGIVQDFVGATFRMIFTASGLWHIFLFFIPLILYLLFFARLMETSEWSISKKARWIIFFGIAMVCVDAFLGTKIVMRNNEQLKKTYKANYSFAMGVDRFGLMTGLRLDLIRKGNTDMTVSMEIEEEWDDLEDWDESPAQEELQPEDEESNLTESASVVEEQDVSDQTEEEPEEKQPSILPETWEVKPAVADIDLEALAENAPSTYVANMLRYAASQTPSNTNQMTGIFKGKNLILICAEAFCSYAIREDLTPTLYRMATRGINFLDYTQSYSCGTTGGECSYLMGVLPVDGSDSMMEIIGHNNYYTMGSFLDREGYYGKAFHNHRYTYYNRHLTHEWLGYSDGYMGMGNGMEEFVTQTWAESDVEMFTGTYPMYKDKSPFNIYYMTVSGHDEYRENDNAQCYYHYDEVKDLPYSYQVQCYFAANLELEYSMQYLIEQLEKDGLADDTVIVISGDHFPYGLGWYDALGYKDDLNELYGFTVKTYLERDQNQLIIWSGCLEKEDPIVVEEPVCAIDVLPTLLNLFGCEWDSRLLPGRDVFSKKLELVFDCYGNWKTTKGVYDAFTGKFTPKDASMHSQEEYVKRINTTVNNKLKYCGVILNTDFFEYIFPTEENDGS
ncbi:MAG: sulfatase-like hydrolase/transferase [Firmicutes bacterium]|nr:sulfatase-like hydrolase/transferase [Bacillota bacterium]